MTDEPATTPDADRCPASGCEGEPGHDGLHYDGHGIEWSHHTAAPADRVTALTLRCGQLREQRDEARRERDECVGWCNDLRDNLIHARTERDEARRHAREAIENAASERDEARAQAVAATTAADDLRATMQALAAEWWGRATEATSETPSWRRACRELLATLGDTAQRAGSVHRAETGAEVATSATPDLLGPQIGAEPFDVWIRQPVEVTTNEAPREAGAHESDLRARVERIETVVSTWPPGPRKDDVLRALDGGV